MNNYQSHQELIRLFKAQLLGYQIKSITSLSLGIISIVAVPLIGNSFSLRDKIINITGFIGGLSSLSYCLIINPKLRELEGKNTMIKELEKTLFIDEQMLIYHQFRQQQQPQLIYSDQPVVDVIGNSGNSVTGNGVTSDLPMVTDVTNSVTEVLPVDVTDNIITEVTTAIDEGKSDTFIIKNILKCEGRNYSKGKELLEIIRSENEL